MEPDSKKLTGESQNISESPNSDEAVPKPTSPEGAKYSRSKSIFSLRWSYFVPRAVILAAVWAAIHFGLDPLLRSTMIATGETLNGAQVNIGQVETSIKETRIEISDVAIANSHKPGRNLIRFDSAQLHLAGRPLLKKRFVIDQARITGLCFDTSRSDDGRLTDSPEVESESRIDLSPLKEQLTAGVKLWFDDLAERTRAELDPQQLQTVQVSDDIQTTWTRDLNDYERRIRDLKLQVELIESTAKRDGRIDERLQSLGRATLETKKLVAEAAQLRRELADLSPRAKADFHRLQDAKDQDLQAVRSRVDELQLDAETISRALLGQQTAQQLATVVEWSRRLQSVFASDEVEPSASERGVTFDFSRPSDGPQMHLMSVVVSGVMTIDGREIPYSGEIRDISSDPSRLDQPVVFELTAEDGQAFHLIGKLDQRTPGTPKIEAQFDLQLRDPLTSDLGNDRIALSMSSKQVQIGGWCRLANQQIEGRVDCRHPKLQIKTHLPDNGQQQVGSRFLASAFDEATSQIREANTSVVFQGEATSPRLWFESDLGETLSNGLRSGLRTALIPQQEELAQRIQVLAGERSNLLDQQINGRLGTLMAELNLHERKAGGLLDRVAGTGRFSFDRILR